MATAPWRYQVGAWAPDSRSAPPSRMVGGAVRVGTKLNLTSDGSGSYQLNDADALFGGAPVRSSSAPLPWAHGQLPQRAQYGSKPFTISGEFTVDQLAQLGDAEDYLHRWTRLAYDGEGLVAVYFRRPSWGAGRFVRARMAGAVNVTSPDQEQAATPWRTFTIPMEADDPKSYSIGLYTRTVTSAGLRNLNSGSWQAPWRAVFPGGTEGPHIAIDGHHIRVHDDVPHGRTLTIDSAQRTIRLDNGVSLRGVSSCDWADINPGGRVSVAAGQHATLTYRDTWM